MINKSMKHILPFNESRVREELRLQHQFLAKLKAKCKELGIKWRDSAGTAAESRGSATLQFTPKEAFLLATESGYESHLTGGRLTSYNRRLDRLIEKVGDPRVFDVLTLTHGNSFKYAIQPSSIRRMLWNGGYESAGLVNFADSSQRSFRSAQTVESALGMFASGILNDLVSDNLDYYARMAAQSRQATPEQLQIMAELGVALAEVAGNPNTSPEVLLELAGMASGRIAEVAKKNPNFPSDVAGHLFDTLGW